MNLAASIFWWVVVCCCIYSIFFWANKRYSDGSHGLLMPSGQIFIWMLIAALATRVLDLSPWHLLWLTPICLVVSVIIGKMLMRRAILMRGR